MYNLQYRWFQPLDVIHYTNKYSSNHFATVSSYNQLIGVTRVYPDDLKSDAVPIAPEFVNLKLSDLKILATLGVGGFGRVELVRLLTLCAISLLS